MWKIIILIAILIIGALFIKNVSCGCGSIKKETDAKDIDKKNSCCS